jgi:hypothetical protein
MESLLEVSDIEQNTETIVQNDYISDMADQDINVNELTFIRDKIENMSKYNQINILRIFKKYDCIVLNENSYGIHINLTELKRNVINELLEYIKYVHEQENTLLSIEQQKEDFKNVYFVKDNKDNSKILV